MSTTALYKALIHANVPEELAEKAVESLPHASEMLTKADLRDFATKADLKDFATKADLAEIKAALKDFATKADLKDFATKADLNHFATKADLAETEVRLIKWMAWLMIGIVGAMIALFGLFLG